MELTMIHRVSRNMLVPILLLSTSCWLTAAARSAPAKVAAAYEVGGNVMTFLPEVYLGMSSGTAPKEAKLGGVEPTLKGTIKGAARGIALEASASVDVRDLDDTPFSLWAAATKKIGRWNVLARFNSQSENLNAWGIKLQASSRATSLTFQGGLNSDQTVSDGTAFKADQVRLTQIIKGDAGAFWILSPGYDLRARESDLCVVYGTKSTAVFVNAKRDSQKVAVSQIMGDHVLTPSFTSNGPVELEWRKFLSSGGSIAATVQPIEQDGMIAVELQEGPWHASVKAPLNDLSDLTVNLRRKIGIPFAIGDPAPLPTPTSRVPPYLRDLLWDATVDPGSLE